METFEGFLLSGYNVGNGQVTVQVKILKTSKKDLQLTFSFSSDMLNAHTQKATSGRLIALCIQIVEVTENKHLPISTNTNLSSQKTNKCLCFTEKISMV